MSILEGRAMNADRAARFLSYAIFSTSEERAGWKPRGEAGVEGKSVLEIASHIVGSNMFFKAMLSGEEPSGGDNPTYTTTAEAAQAVADSGAAMAAFLKSADESILSKTIETRYGPMSGLIMTQIPATHMDYHTGQVSYIQVLYGDNETHFPPQE